MPLIQVLIVLIVVGVLLWLKCIHPPADCDQRIVNAVVVIVVVLWLLIVFAVLHTLANIRVGWKGSPAPLLRFPGRSHGLRAPGRAPPGSVCLLRGNPRRRRSPLWG